MCTLIVLFSIVSIIVFFRKHHGRFCKKLLLQVQSQRLGQTCACGNPFCAPGSRTCLCEVAELERRGVPDELSVCEVLSSTTCLP